MIKSCNNPESLLSFNAKRNVLEKPIENVQTVIESGVDTFINNANENEKKKRIKKRAIAASSSVIVLGTLTMLLNPRSTGKINKHLNNLREKIGIKIKQQEKGTFKNDLLKFWNKTLSGVEKCGNAYFNLNSFKDWVWDDLCTNSNKKYPKFLTKNKAVHKTTKAVDNFWVKMTKKPNETITKWFDNISKKTVKNKYKTALKELDSLEIALKAHKEKLSIDKQILIEKKLKEIAKAKEAFNEENVLIRLKKQENMMLNLKEDFRKKIYNKKDGWLKNKTSFWAKDILAPQKIQVEKDGVELYEALFGSENKRGLYREATDILRNSLDEKEYKNLKKDLENASKKVKNANLSECVEYFDKKRDLVLGGAPTDIITQLFGLALCGWSVTKAEKEDRWSKLLNTGVPVITGLGSSLYFSAKLYSGAKSIIYGAILSGLTTLGCHIFDKHVLGNDEKEEEEKEENKNVIENLKPEVQNA